jgi:uncharacterized protein (DUF1501 family)
MRDHQATKAEKTPGALSRRDFLKAGSLGAGAVGLTLADLHAGAADRGVNCILLFLVGGPSQLETFDPKPGAPSNVRGPFKATRTNVPGVALGEHLPRLARMADRFALLRSVHHEAAPIHETGQQMMQTGRLFRGGREYPHYGSVVSALRGPKSAGVPPFVLLPGPIASTGVNVSHGQGPGALGPDHEPACLRELSAAGMALDVASEKPSVLAAYGEGPFGRSCLLGRRLVERGVRFVTVNMFDTVFNEVTWDCHADGGSLASTLDDYRRTLCPAFDAACSALLEDLKQRGLLDSTLVLAMGEFGRTPLINSRGGRDHWPGVWSVLLAGGGVRGGQVVGSSDHLGAEPTDRPTTPAEVAATVYHALGIDLHTTLPGPDGRPVPVVEAAPVRELF